MNYTTSQQGISFVKRHEGLRLTAYMDPGGVCTIGYGHTGNDVYPGKTITLAEAESYLNADLKTAENAVNSLVTVYIPQFRFDSLVSLVFNVGRLALSQSKLLAKLNQGNIEGAATEFDDWNLVNGVPNQGLKNRRADEKELFLNGNYNGSTTGGGTTGGGTTGGGSNDTISQIQSTLNARYSTGLVVDGLYGANTKKGMIKGLQTEFNKQYGAGLTVDGLWGPKTKAACPIIYENSSGNIQYIIKAGLYCIAGFTSLTVNGSYDANTVSAVKNFQRAKNLGVDGRTGPETFAALFG